MSNHQGKRKSGTEPDKSPYVTQNSKDQTAKIYQRDKISFKLNVARPLWTPKQEELIEIIRHSDTKYVFIKGASGTSKTFISLATGLELLNLGRIKEIILVRSILESGAVGLGSLPGDEKLKMSPFMAPFEEKLAMLLPKDEIKKLHEDERLVCLPVNYMRGREFNASYIIVDEAQNLNEHEIQTALTRLGKYSKMIIAGDTEQVDYIKGKKAESGFRSFYDWYNKEEAEIKGIHCFKFGIEDIMREDIIKYMVTEYDLFRQRSK